MDLIITILLLVNFILVVISVILTNKLIKRPKPAEFDYLAVLDWRLLGDFDT